MLHSRNRDNTMKYVLIAGEASGDLHASHLIKHIRENDPEAEFRFSEVTLWPPRPDATLSCITTA